MFLTDHDSHLFRGSELQVIVTPDITLIRGITKPCQAFLRATPGAPLSRRKNPPRTVGFPAPVPRIVSLHLAQAQGSEFFGVIDLAT